MKINMDYFLSKDTFLKFSSSFLIAFGTIWLLIEFPSSHINNFKTFIDINANYILCVSIFISLLFGVFKIIPKKRIYKKFIASNTSIEIIIGDLFKDNVNILIGSSNYFDTNSNISNSTLKSQLINRCFSGETKHLDELIESSLSVQNLSGIFDESKPFGKKNKFPIGTTIRIDQNNRQIFMLIISELFFNGTNKHTSSTPDLLNTALYKFWNFYKTEGRMKEISIPVLGSGLARVNLSYRVLIQLIILSFITYSKSTRITEKLKIVVYEKDYNPEDFEELNKFVNSIDI
jgi:hypothetical protein